MSNNDDKTSDITICVTEAPTKERAHQNGGVVCEVIDRDYHGKILVHRYRAVWECPLDAYLDYKVINEAEHKAGLLFRRAYLSALWGRRTAYERLEKNLAYKDPAQCERMLRQAYRTLPSHSKGVIIDICGHDQPAQDQVKLNTLKKGLGHLVILWEAAAIEVFGR